MNIFIVIFVAGRDVKKLKKFIYQFRLSKTVLEISKSLMFFWFLRNDKNLRFGPLATVHPIWPSKGRLYSFKNLKIAFVLFFISNQVYYNYNILSRGSK